MQRITIFAAVYLYFASLTNAAHLEIEDKTVYFNACDGSAAVALTDRFFAGASDEDNWLRVYDRIRPGGPVQTINLSPLLGLSQDDETDIEGAAKVENISYWITSHGADKHGNPSSSRRFLFGLKTTPNSSQVDFSLAGKPYRNLINDLTDVPSIPEFDFRAAAKLPPKEKGALNIEGLAAFNEELYIGFRNPIIDNKALIVVLRNPKELLTGHAGKPKWGDAILLNLSGRGIRDIQYDESTQSFWVIAGSIDEERDFALYEWKGRGHAPKQRNVDFGKWNPEAVIVWPDRPTSLQILSDDGTRLLDNSPENDPCKNLPIERRQFRSGWLKIFH